MKKEIRMMELRAVEQPSDSSDMIVEGYAATYGQETVMWEYDGVQYKEVIAPGAFDGCDMSDVPFRYNHSDKVMIMARTRNKSLTLSIDEKGLKIRAKIAPTTAGKDLYTLINGKYVDKMSFAFKVQKDSYDRSTHLRTIEKFEKLYDVAAVDIPAYDSTSIGVPDAEQYSARSYFKTQREFEEKVKQDLEARKKRILIATYL